MVRLYNNFGLCAFIFWVMRIYILGYARLKGGRRFLVFSLIKSTSMLMGVLFNVLLNFE